MAWKHRKLIANLANGALATYQPGPDTDELIRHVREEGEQVLAAARIPMVTAEQDLQRRGDLLQGRAPVATPSVRYGRASPRAAAMSKPTGSTAKSC